MGNEQLKRAVVEALTCLSLSHKEADIEAAHLRAEMAWVAMWEMEEEGAFRTYGGTAQAKALTLVLHGLPPCLMHMVIDAQGRFGVGLADQVRFYEDIEEASDVACRLLQPAQVA